MKKMRGREGGREGGKRGTYLIIDDEIPADDLALVLEGLVLLLG